ncbi:MAG: HAMP domain-containing histidine kinase [Oligoflexia bacterium]|nr:HAMP domain-containing histidine kinase [Oligoflexia bacterium]MBF0364007.1 HAMP domain-containing histidine kinase [Oligoflexia bacterium]
MKTNFFILQPLVIFIFSIVALVLSLTLFLHWYFRMTSEFNQFIGKFKISPDVFWAPHSWVIIVITSVLLGCILVGLAIIFTYYQKTIQLYTLQESFINNFSHELKTPIASIKLYLETINKYNLPREKQLEFVSFMLKDTSRLSEHVQQILLAGGLEQRQSYKATNTISTDITNFIREFLKSNAHLFNNAKIEMIDKSLVTTPIIMQINPTLFETLLMNLITNAIKHNHQAVPRLQITLSQNKKITEITFSDNGLGLKKEEQKHIFQKFYQIDRKTTTNTYGTHSPNKNPKGSGLGLYITKQITKIHFGKITASSPGLEQGTTFVLHFPRNINLFTRIGLT